MTRHERTWRASALCAFPTQFEMPPDGGMPEKLEPIRRMRSQHAVVEGRSVAVRECESPAGLQPDLRWSWADVLVEVNASEGQDAVNLAMETFETVLESLSFQLQTVIQIQSLEVLDLTPPLTLGEQREILSFPIGVGYPLRRFRPGAVQMAGVFTQAEPDLSFTIANLDARHRAAMDWYLKALATPAQVDQYMDLWIATEILWSGSGVTVDGPYVARCGHEIAACPVCDAETTRQVRGQSIKRFLTDLCGVDDGTARDLWRARQIMHGAERFDSKVMDELDRLSQVLRTVINARLKGSLGLAEEAAPIVLADQLSIAPHMALGGTRAVDSDDIAPIGQTSA